MKLALIAALLANSGVLVWAVNKQPGPQVMCPMKVKPGMRGKWLV
jgi:hypothetical protein